MFLDDLLSNLYLFSKEKDKIVLFCFFSANAHLPELDFLELRFDLFLAVVSKQVADFVGPPFPVFDLFNQRTPAENTILEPLLQFLFLLA